jgi:hypothetical protein
MPEARSSLPKAFTAVQVCDATGADNYSAADYKKNDND